MSTYGLISAFTVGALSFLNPCALPLLPAYLSYFLGKEEENDESKESELTQKALKGGIKGIFNGLKATAGFAVVYLSIGVLVSYLSRSLQESLRSLSYTIGAAVLISLGIIWVTRKSSLYLPKVSGKIRFPKNSVFLFGIAYALGSLACTLPLFTMIIITSMRSGVLVGLEHFIAYTLGMGVMMIIASTSMALSKDLIIDKFESLRKYVKKIGGLILILTGIYILITKYLGISLV